MIKIEFSNPYEAKKFSQQKREDTLHFSVQRKPKAKLNKKICFRDPDDDEAGDKAGFDEEHRPVSGQSGGARNEYIQEVFLYSP